MVCSYCFSVAREKKSKDERACKGEVLLRVPVEVPFGGEFF
jgi:hypothetical protein